MDDVKDFYSRYYHQRNAIVGIAGHLKANEVQKLASRWFGNIAPGDKKNRQITPEPVQHNPWFL